MLAKQPLPRYKVNPSNAENIFKDSRTKTMLSETWFSEIFNWYLKQKGFKEVITTDAMRKGREMEDEAIEFLEMNSDLFFLEQLAEHRPKEVSESLFVRGIGDVVKSKKKYGIDIKVSESLFSYTKAELTAKYKIQGYCYMHLYNLDKYYIAYVLLESDTDTIEQQFRKIDWNYKDAAENRKHKEQILKNNDFSELDKADRITLFEINKDAEYRTFLFELKWRVQLSRKMIASFSGLNKAQNYERANAIFQNFMNSQNKTQNEPKPKSKSKKTA